MLESWIGSRSDLLVVLIFGTTTKINFYFWFMKRRLHPVEAVLPRVGISVRGVKKRRRTRSFHQVRKRIEAYKDLDQEEDNT